ncbi:MAG: CmcI family methyltransferase [Candidatus Paceibacterota bacterium]
MQLIIDTDRNCLTKKDSSTERELPLYSKEAFDLISQQWLRVGWDQKYAYTFAWMGRPVIQLPEDLLRAQEVIYRLQPDVIIETGVAHGGSLVFNASLCKVLERGRVIGIDIEIRPHNRQAIEAHHLASLITLIEGNSVSDETVRRVEALIAPTDKVLVFLDSCHTKDHVRAELEAYAGLVTPGSYIVATDGLMADVHDAPRGDADWQENNPAAAAKEFVAAHPEFVIEQPEWPFNESSLTQNITHWPHAWLKRSSQ